MLVDLDAKDLRRLIYSIRFADMGKCDALQDIGVMRFCGNQWNPDWEICINLEGYSEEQLVAIYNCLKGLREVERSDGIEEQYTYILNLKRILDEAKHID